MITRIASVPVALTLAMVLSACQTTGGQQNGNDGSGNGGDDATTTGVDTASADGEGDDANSLGTEAPDERVIYFDFDKSEIRSEYLEIIAQHGRFLATNGTGRVRLEGHTDERGTREYNIALGERRAQAIARMLQLQGVSSAQTRSISYGEEIPVDEGHSNDAWSKNRRVVIIYEASVQN